MKNKTCKDCEFISKKKKFDVETNKHIDVGFYCGENEQHLKVFNPCEDFKQRKIVDKKVFNWMILIGGLILGLIFGLIFGSILGLIFGLIVGSIFGFTDKKKIYKDSNIDEEKDEK